MSEKEVVTLKKIIENIDNIPGIKNCSKNKIYKRQWLMTMNLLLVVMLIGMAHGHSAILDKQMQRSTANETQDLKLENGEIFKKPIIIVDSIHTQSWILSSMVLFMIPGCWILAICSKKIGRKPILLYTIIIFLISWLIIIFAENSYHVIVGRSLSGLCIGVLAGLTSVYQGEISIPKLRATLNAFSCIFLSIGIGLCHAIGTCFHWRTTALFCCFCTAITLLTTFRLPESPIWLLHKNKLHDAINSWVFLRGTRDFDELTSMHVTESNNVLKKVYSEKEKNSFCKASFLKPLGIMLGLFTATQMSGMGAVTYYCIQMITDISGPDYAYVPTLLLDTFRLLGSVILTLLSSRVSTRKLTLWSSFSCAFFLIFLSIAISLNIWNQWLALTFLFAYEAAIFMGLGTLPWSFCSELFSVSHKEIGIGIVTSYNYLLFFAVVKINPFLFMIMNRWAGFLFYGCFTLISSIGLYFILPNTKSKTLKEIDLMFSSD